MIWKIDFEQKLTPKKGILSFSTQKFFDKFSFSIIMDMSVVQNVENIETPKLKVVHT